MIKILELKGNIIIYGPKNNLFGVRENIAFNTNMFMLYSNIVRVVGDFFFWKLTSHRF